MVVVHVYKFLERSRPQLRSSSCLLHSMDSLSPHPHSFFFFSEVVQSVDTISALAVNARDQLGSQESE